MPFDLKKFLALFALLLWGQVAWGINFSSIYVSSCQREIGVIVQVDENTVHLLTLEGQARKIPRFDIIYIASYPMGFPRIREVSGSSGFNLVTIRTLHEGQIVDLLRGWMTDYSEEQISFLTTDGTETVIDIANIWDIEIAPFTDTLQFKQTRNINHRFHPPYPFLKCPEDHSGETGGEGKPVTLYPQFLLGDPLMIKKELDRLEKGYTRLTEYADNKKFYPVPQVYGNDTILGLWYNTGSRYGASQSRTNNLIPMLRSELSEGPFHFQRVWITGAGPMPWSIQEEIQNQLYYRLKSDYLHFSILYDIERLVIGESTYRWKSEDLNPRDDRINEIFHIGGGFDRGPFAFGYTITNTQYAIRFDDRFFFSRAMLHKFDLTYHHRDFRVDFIHAFGSDRKPTVAEAARGNTEEDLQAAEAELALIPDWEGDHRIYRFNLRLTLSGDFQLLYSAIHRKLDFHLGPDPDGLGEFVYRSESVTNALYLDFPLDPDLRLHLYFSLEAHSNSFGLILHDESDSAYYPKGGIGLMLRI